MNIKVYIYILIGVLVIGLIIYLFFKRNYFNKYKYVRLVKYNDDMTETVQYIKRKIFNKGNEEDHILINPKHIYNFKGYTSVIITSKSQESINPIDFESKYSAKDYKTAMKSKHIKDAFDSMKVEKFDKVMFLLILSIVQLIAIAYLLYNLIGVK